MANDLSPGDVRVGHLFDGIADGFPDQTATLLFDEKRGAELTIPFLSEPVGGPNPQYRKAAEWFHLNHPALPKTLLFQDSRGMVVLNDLHVSGWSGLDAQVGRARAHVAIFGRPREVMDEYLVADFISTIDGLEEFTRFQPVKLDVGELEGGVRRTIVTIESSESVEWAAGDFRYTIHSNVAWNGADGHSFHILDSQPYLQTTSDTRASVSDHLSAQWPVRALLILVFGDKLAWRSHKIRDDQFPLWMLDGSDRGAHSVEVHHANTVEQHRHPKPENRTFVFPLARLSDIGADGMKKWVELYADEVFQHAVEPAVEVVNGASRFLEPQLMMLAISLDRFGYFRFADQRRRSMATHIAKCLEEANLDWPEIGTRVGIAKSIANINNDLKHPDRELYPDTDFLAGVIALSRVIARAQIFDLLDIDDNLRQEFLKSNDVRNAVRIFTSSGITVDDEGGAVRTRAAETPSQEVGEG